MVPNACVLLAVASLLTVVQGQSSTTTILTTTRSDSSEVCASLNASCGECVANRKCFWCESSETCIRYPGSEIIPPSSLCALSDAKFVTCAVNLAIVIIVCGSLAGVIVIAFTVCICWCCCCRGRSGLSRREMREDQAEEARNEQRRTRNAERRAERQARWDELRRKYGLSTNNSPGNYSRFSNDDAEA